MERTTNYAHLIGKRGVMDMIAGPNYTVTVHVRVAAVRQLFGRTEVQVEVSAGCGNGAAWVALDRVRLEN